MSTSMIPHPAGFDSAIQVLIEAQEEPCTYIVCDDIMYRFVWDLEDLDYINDDCRVYKFDEDLNDYTDITDTLNYTTCDDPLDCLLTSCGVHIE